ncbi:MAG: hypothetical protein HRT72_04265 [Flavobacteriales bacterium]|nr:hypothetical protein [Flavobacteriales bacterium]
MSEIIEVISVILLSAIKQLLGGSSLAVIYGFNFEKAFVCTSVGGIIGITVFYYLAEPVLKMWMKVESKIFKKAYSKEDEDVINKDSFVKKTMDKYGIMGLAILSPILSYPFALFLARRFFEGKTKILISMYISALIWAGIGSLFFSQIADAVMGMF